MEQGVMDWNSGGSFWLDIRKKLFTARVARHWNRLHNQVMDAPCLEVFKVQGCVQSDLVEGVAAPSRELEVDSL